MRLRQHGGCDDQRGFTLIELMVVVLIIGILVAIALPTFLGIRERAEDKVAQSDLRNGLGAALSYFSDDATFNGFSPLVADGVEPNLAWVGAGAPAPRLVAIEVAAGRELLLTARSTTGMYFCISKHATSPDTDFGEGPAFADIDTVPECVGGW